MWRRRFLHALSVCVVLAVAYMAHGYLQNHRVKPSRDTHMASQWVPTVQAFLLKNPARHVAWSLYGDVEPREVARMQALQSGKVKKVHVQKGDSVKKDAVLLELDAPLARLKWDKSLSQQQEVQMQIAMQSKTTEYEKDRLQQAKQKSQWIEKKYLRSKQLLEKKVISQEQFDNVSMERDNYKHAVQDATFRIAHSQAQEKLLEARKKQYQIAQESARVELEQAQTLSPMNGTMQDIQVSEGDDVRVGAPVATVQSAQWRVRSLLSYGKSKQLLSSKQAAKAQAHVVSQGARYPVLFEASHPSSMAMGNDVLFHVKDDANVLWQTGQTVELIVNVPVVVNAWAVPAAAVYRSQHVYVLKPDDTIQRVDVEVLGFEGETGRPVVASQALQSGDKIVGSLQGDFVSGMRVRVDA